MMATAGTAVVVVVVVVVVETNRLHVTFQMLLKPQILHVKTAANLISVI